MKYLWQLIVQLVLIFAMQICPYFIYSQISQDFYKALPDSIQPKSPNKLVFNDLTNIYKYVFSKKGFRVIGKMLDL